MSLTAAERLEQARRARQEIGVGMDDFNALAAASGARIEQ